jgi:hypothetical protein
MGFLIPRAPATTPAALRTEPRPRVIERIVLQQRDATGHDIERRRAGVEQMSARFHSLPKRFFAALRSANNAGAAVNHKRKTAHGGSMTQRPSPKNTTGQANNAGEPVRYLKAKRLSRRQSSGAGSRGRRQCLSEGKLSRMSLL